MAALARLSITLEPALLARLGRRMRAARAGNRSKFLADLIRRQLVEETWAVDGEALGTITLVYDHAQRALSDRLVALQHRHHAVMLATTHVHLDEDYCAEAVMMRGRASELREVADLMRRQKGVLHAALSMSAVGPGLGRTPAHRHSRAHSHPHAHPH